MRSSSLCLLVSGRFSYTDKAATVIYKFTNCCNHFRILPIITACVSCVSITYIDNNINVI